MTIKAPPETILTLDFKFGTMTGTMGGKTIFTATHARLVSSTNEVLYEAPLAEDWRASEFTGVPARAEVIGDVGDGKSVVVFTVEVPDHYKDGDGLTLHFGLTGKSGSV